MIQEKQKSSPSLTGPALLAFASLSMVTYGVFYETWCIGLGFVLLTTSILTGLMVWGGGDFDHGILIRQRPVDFAPTGKEPNRRDVESGLIVPASLLGPWYI